MKSFCFTVLSLALYFVLPSCNSNSADEPLVPSVEEKEEIELDDSEFDFVEDASTLYEGAKLTNIEGTPIYSTGFSSNDHRQYHYDIDKYGYTNGRYAIATKTFHNPSEFDSIPHIKQSFKQYFPEGIDWGKQSLVVVSLQYAYLFQGSDGFTAYQKDGKFKFYINALPIPGLYCENGHSYYFIVIDQPNVKATYIRSYALPKRSHIDYFENK